VASTPPPRANGAVPKVQRIKERRETDPVLDSQRAFQHQTSMRERRSLGTITRLLCTAAALLAPVTGYANPTCPADPAMDKLNLPHFHAALANRSQGVIVALGSSSTAGAMAADSAHTYPAILQRELSNALPNAHIAVINRGIGGQDAPEELARLGTDVIALHPQLVIWQVGANGAMRHADPGTFHHMVEEGVKRLLKANIDVVLMDNQRSPRVLAAADHIILEEALAHVARETGANLFSRSHLMDFWSDQGAKPSQFIASDGLHQNDLGYLCVTQSLGRLIVSAVNAPVTVSASR
jgi:acyl-CoA thioesterase I